MIIVHGVVRKLIGVNNMKDNENVLLVVSPDVAKKIIEKDHEVSKILVVCTFASPDIAVIVKREDFDNMIDNGVWYTKEEN